MSVVVQKSNSLPRTLGLPDELQSLPIAPDYDQLYPCELYRLLMRHGLPIPSGNPESLAWRAQAIQRLRRNALAHVDLSFRQCG